MLYLRTIRYILLITVNGTVLTIIYPESQKTLFINLHFNFLKIWVSKFITLEIIVTLLAAKDIL